jgi:secreted trypsin-like serine protease
MPLSPDSQFCGGSIILDTWVLTAAHCIYWQGDDGKYFDLNPAAIAVVAGTNVLAEGQGDKIPVKAIFRHPAYVGEEYDNDIALIQLARKPKVAYQKITVPDAEFGDMLDQPGVITMVTGWGLTDGAMQTATLRQAEIEMLPREACNEALIEDRAAMAVQPFIQAVQAFGLSGDQAQGAWEDLLARVPRPLSPNMLCSGTYEGGKGACNGDSGGPLVVPLKDGKFIQAGIVSWGLADSARKSCDEQAKFSAYTRISNYIGWLGQTISSAR